jgi:hypothetical protein
MKVEKSLSKYLDSDVACAYVSCENLRMDNGLYAGKQDPDGT